MPIGTPVQGGIADEAIPSITETITTTANNTLIAIVGANAYGASAEDDCKISSVIDSAHNVWVEAVTEWGTSAGDLYAATRISIWICIGARAVTSVTATATQNTDAMAINVVEVSGIGPASSALEVVSSGDYDGLTVPAAITTLSSATLVIAACTLGSTELSTSGPAGTAGFFEMTQRDSTSTTAKNNVLLRSAYLVSASTGAKSRTWTINQGAGVAWACISLKAGSLVTTNPHANWPTIVHEVDFGVDPNDPTSADFATPTDITSRVNGFMSRRGRDYELARTEAGELQVDVNNYDSRFDPLNASGTYYPDVRVITPYRVRATWNGQLYRLFTGYVERWPQRWVDERGTSRLAVVDGLAVLANTLLQGSIGSEITDDDPWAYWPLDDGALAGQAKNSATTTSTPLAVQTSPNGGGFGFFGADMSLQSEQSSCWRQTRTQTTGTLDTYGTCLGAPLTLPQLADGVLMECWAKFASLAGSYAYTLLALKGSSFSSNADHRIALLQVDSTTGLPTLRVSTSAGVLQDYTGSASGYNDDSWHHYVVHVTATTANLWIDGTLRATGAPASTTSATIDYFEVGGEVDPYITGTADAIMVGDLAHVAIFELATVDDRRVAARANAGLTGFPEKTGARMNRLLNYSGWTGGRAIDEGLTFLGAAATIARQTILAAAQDVASWENGLVFVDGSGYLRFVARDTHFNQTVRWTFGENTAGGELPYETDVEIEFDPRYVYNDVTVTRSVLRLPDGTVVTGGSSAHQTDSASVMSYFTRTYAKNSGANSLSQCNAEATWILENYAQPRARLSRITITPSTNANLWPVALGAEIGDLVRVKRRPFGGGDVITLDCYVEQIAHRVQPGSWQTVLTLSPELLTTYAGQSSWVLGTSVLGIDTIVGSP